MAMRGSRKDYKFGQKNHWRRTVWNEVLRRTAGREYTEPILYLAGPQDLDRAIALDKGVPGQNLIAVDRDQKNIASVRAAKYPVIYGDIEDVIASWPISRPVCAVLLDFCAGFVQPTVDVYDLLERKPFRESVVMINMQRGRDSYSNVIREEFIGNGEDVFPWMQSVARWGYGSCGPAEGLPDTHRGLQWLTYHALDAAKVNERELTDAAQTTPGYQPGYEDALLLMFAGNYFKFADPVFYSYKSGVLTFDSVVCTNPLRLLSHAAKAEEITHQFDDIAERQHASQRSVEMSRKIAAMLAVRTARLA